MLNPSGHQGQPTDEIYMLTQKKREATADGPLTKHQEECPLIPKGWS